MIVLVYDLALGPPTQRVCEQEAHQILRHRTATLTSFDCKRLTNRFEQSTIEVQPNALEFRERSNPLNRLSKNILVCQIECISTAEWNQLCVISSSSITALINHCTARLLESATEAV